MSALGGARAASAVEPVDEMTLKGITVTWTDPSMSDLAVTETPGKADNLPDGLTAEDVDELAAEGAGESGDQGPYLPGSLGSPGSVGIMVNGCSYSPDRFFDVNFKPTCDRHDRCYEPSSYTDRLVCDRTFLVGLYSACDSTYSGTTARLNSCRAVAIDYYGAVRNLGSSHYAGRGLNN